MVEYAGMTDAAREEFEVKRKEEIASRGWGDMSPEENIKAFRDKFKARRALGMLKVKQKYAEGGGKEDAEAEEAEREQLSEEEVEKQRLEALEAVSGEVRDKLYTSVDPEKVADPPLHLTNTCVRTAARGFGLAGVRN